jgi:hypothetical protein
VDKGPNGWLQAKETISRLIEEDFDLKRRRSRKRVGRYLEDCKPAISRTSSENEIPVTTLLHVDAPQPPYMPVLPASTTPNAAISGRDAVDDLLVTIEARDAHA